MCQTTGVRQDLCVIDVFIAAVRFMAGESAKPWWKYTGTETDACGPVQKPGECLTAADGTELTSHKRCGRTPAT